MWGPWEVGSGDCVIAVSTYIGGTHSSGVLSSSACDVVSVVRAVGGVCDMCMCLARDGVGGIGGGWVTGFGLCFTNYGGTWEKWDMCLCFVAVVWVVLGESGWAA